MSYGDYYRGEKKPITLPKLRCLEAPVEQPTAAEMRLFDPPDTTPLPVSDWQPGDTPEKIVGGDLHRAQAIPPRDVPKPSTGRAREIAHVRSHKAPANFGCRPPKYHWPDGSVDFILLLFKQRVASSEIAKRLAVAYPPEPGVQITRNTVLGKYDRVTGRTHQRLRVQGEAMRHSSFG